MRYPEIQDKSYRISEYEIWILKRDPLFNGNLKFKKNF
jgi:hypothetical protein